ncbi:MAG: hypothetical protein Q8P67_22825, partial [archaeon]|nr:hypothetical protein [archaeon]
SLSLSWLKSFSLFFVWFFVVFFVEKEIELWKNRKLFSLSTLVGVMFVKRINIENLKIFCTHLFQQKNSQNLYQNFQKRIEKDASRAADCSPASIQMVDATQKGDVVLP